MKNTKTALITGGARGIGEATALTLAKSGCDIAIVDLDRAGAEAVAAKIRELGRRALAITSDVSIPLNAQNVVQQVKSEFDGIHVLVNNAGITRDAMLSKMTEEQWDAVIQVNLKGPFLMTQACAKEIASSGGGRIINVSSIARFGNVGQTNYSASKAGIEGMTRTWALELSRHGITVNAIAPGFIDTQMTQAVPEPIREKFIQRIPLKRLGKPQDIAEAIAFLASDAAAYITGQCIQVDGGLTTGVNL